MLLAIDSSTQTMGVALYDGVVVRGELVWQTRNHHTVELAPAIRLLMSQVGVTAQQLSALGVALGPGSFTTLTDWTCPREGHGSGAAFTAYWHPHPGRFDSRPAAE